MVTLFPLTQAGQRFGPHQHRAGLFLPFYCNTIQQLENLEKRRTASNFISTSLLTAREAGRTTSFIKLGKFPFDTMGSSESKVRSSVAVPNDQNERFLADFAENG